MSFSFRLLFSVTLLLSGGSLVYSQVNEITFGEVPREFVEMTVYKDDPEADAVILDDYCVVRLDNFKGLTVKVDRHIRIKIINTNGLDYANVKLPYNPYEKISNIQAACYNIENEQVVQHKINKKDIYIEETNRYRKTLMFTLPNVRVGSVIEYRYSYESNDYFTLYSMAFQHEIPLRCGGLRVEIPGYFQYKILPRGNFDRVKVTRRNDRVNFGSSYVDGLVAQWYAVNIPPFKYEPFSTGSDDYYTAIDFELSKIEIRGYYFEDIYPSYSNLAKKLYDRVDFGYFLEGGSFLKKKVDEIIAGVTSEVEKLERVRKYVADYMMWNGYPDYTGSESIRKVYNEEKGTSGDINLLLIVMLRLAGLSADPVILSTRENGTLNTAFAAIQKINYVVARVTAGGDEYLVDATESLLPYNMLPFHCLNGEGCELRKSSIAWKKLGKEEKKCESVNLDLVINEKGIITGKARNVYQGYDAFAVRKIVKLQGLESIADIQRYTNSNWKITDHILSGLDTLVKPVRETFSLEIKGGAEVTDSLIYFNPVFYGRTETNPFTTEERLTPVDYGCPSEVNYKCRIKIPEGYMIEELPSSAKIAVPLGGGAYTVTYSAADEYITLETNLAFQKTNFRPEERNVLRQFWAQVIEKQAEMIVLRRKNRI